MDFDWHKLDRIEELICAGAASSEAASVQALGDVRAEITDLLSRWERTSVAQAEAVVTSAMLTGELEETRDQLRAEIVMRARAEATFQSLLRLTSFATGTSYFQKLAEGLANALDPCFVLVARVDGVSARTLAVWTKGSMAGDFSYDLEGTPCEVVCEGAPCSHGANVQALFPDDQLLVDMGIESYLGVPLRGPDGVVHGLIVVLDTNPRDDLEDATEIVELFADRASVELLRLETDRHLIEAKEAAEDASRSKSAFLAMISHEIRTPLNGILGMTSILLLDPTLSPDHRGLIDTTHSSGQVLLRVLNDVLDFSKIEAGELEIVATKFDPEQLVEEVAALYDHHTTSKTLSCVAWAESSVPALVSGDETRVRQVLGNLVGNATKFTSQGEVRVVVRSVADGAALEFEVCDTGIGIDSRALAKIFEPFSQADGSMSRQFGGTGLGLSISRQLVEMMDGEIGVESEKGEGSRFWFRVPLEVLRAAPSSAERLSLHVDAAVAAPATRKALSVRLSRLGVDHSIVASLDELGESLASRSPEQDGASPGAVIIDLDLLTGSGQVAFRAVRENLSGQTLIALGNSAAWWGDRLYRQDFSGILTQPMRRAQIEGVLRGLAPGRNGEDASSPPVPEIDTSMLDGRRVLLVEDNPVNSAVATRMLERLGCVVQVACNGLESVERLESESFDAILMDCQMPVMDGFEATRRIREAEAAGACRSPIVAMTANAMADDRERCLEAGMDDYLSKPVDIAKLREVLEHWIEAA